jgi:hypothetical protein
MAALASQTTITGPPGPAAWCRMRGHLVGRMGALLALLSVPTVGGCALAFWLTACLLGLVDLREGAAVVAGAGSLLTLAPGLDGRCLTGRALRRITGRSASPWWRWARRRPPCACGPRPPGSGAAWPTRHPR